MPQAIWTVGHSTRTFAELADLLNVAHVALVADVRRFPGSRRHPHFERSQFEPALAEVGIGYRHFPDLGGRRSARTPGSPNTAWRVEQFNAFADHLATPEGRTALDALAEAGGERNTAILCSEAVPWRCHRRVIADALTARGWTVWDIVGPRKVDRHALTEFARVEPDGTVVYPGLFTEDDA